LGLGVGERHPAEVSAVRNRSKAAARERWDDRASRPSSRGCARRDFRACARRLRTQEGATSGVMTRIRRSVDQRAQGRDLGRQGGRQVREPGSIRRTSTSGGRSSARSARRRIAPTFMPENDETTHLRARFRETDAWNAAPKEGRSRPAPAEGARRGRAAPRDPRHLDPPRALAFLVIAKMCDGSGAAGRRGARRGRPKPRQTRGRHGHGEGGHRPTDRVAQPPGCVDSRARCRCSAKDAA